MSIFAITDAGAGRVADVSALSDDALIDLQRALAADRRRIDAHSAVVAAEIAHRSRHELGYRGLAQKRGMRTPEALVQHVTGVSAPVARTLVRVGTLVARAGNGESSLSDETPQNSERMPWLDTCASAVHAGRISLDAADVIRAGLGSPGLGIEAAALATAADELVRLAAEIPLERLATRARAMRDELDEAGIADREQQRRDRRFFALTPLPDGMTRISGLLDPESAAIVVAAVDAITAPRRGGPRFVESPVPDTSHGADAAMGTSSHDDARTIPQIMVDALVDLVKVASISGDRRLLGSRRVAVRVHVTEIDLRERRGRGHLEGQPDAVSIATVERHVCESGAVPVLFTATGQAIDVGREQRTFTPRQRIALAARDGGCRWPGCERPPGWCEAHHINEWMRDGGRTDLADGALLCRHHHMLVHNNGWRVVRESAGFAAVSPTGERHDMPTKSPLAGRRGAPFIGSGLAIGGGAPITNAQSGAS